MSHEANSTPHSPIRSAAQYDGLFLSNGPGDPQMCGATIENLKKVLARDTPIFGICLGHQLMSIAAGAKTFKLQFGNRGHNQPCTEAMTGRCYITSQNHGGCRTCPHTVPVMSGGKDHRIVA